MGTAKVEALQYHDERLRLPVITMPGEFPDRLEPGGTESQRRDVRAARGNGVRVRLRANLH